MSALRVIFAAADPDIEPDPRMYQHFLKQYHLKAEDCVFIDDTEENVTAAEQIGFAGIVFHSYDDLLAQLNKLGVEIKQ